MFSVRKFLLSGLATATIVGASILKPIKQRDGETSFSLYAYGSFNYSGARIFYSDGQAYLGSGPPSGASETTNVTFTLNSTSQTVSIAPEDSSSTNWTSNPFMFINPATNATDQIGFGGKSNISSSDTFTGFGLYGPWLYHESANGDLEMYFFATETEDGVFALNWNGAGPNPTSGVAVAVRTIAPANPQRAE